MDIADVAEAVAYDAAFLLESFRNPAFPLDELGENALAISERFRTLALIGLIEHADAVAFLNHLSRSGQTRAEYLRRTQACIDNPLHHQVAGRLAPLYDAIAAGDFALATTIGQLSPARWSAQDEYEDDFLVAQLIWRLASTPVPAMDLMPYLDQLSIFLDGQISPEFDVLSALIDADQQAFDTAFEDFLIDYAVKLDQDKTAFRLETPDARLRSNVCIPALAYLRLATKLGLTRQPEYQYCPRLALLLPSLPHPTLDWN